MIITNKERQYLIKKKIDKILIELEAEPEEPEEEYEYYALLSYLEILENELDKLENELE